MKKQKYKVRHHTFKGGNDEVGYTYEITLNKSLVHTGRHRGIEWGLDRYERNESLHQFFENVRDAFVCLWYWITGK